MERKSARYVAARMGKKSAIYLPVKTLSNLISELKTLILEGKLNESIHLSAEQLIYNRMSRMQD